MTSTLELLQLLGKAWVTALTCLPGDDQWQLRIESRPAPHWDEYFSYTYRGSLESVVARAYEGDHDDGAIDVGDYKRFLGSASDHAKVVDRITARLLATGKISQADRDALVGNTRRVLEGAYMAGRCEPAGVQDVTTEIVKVSA